LITQFDLHVVKSSPSYHHGRRRNDPICSTGPIVKPNHFHAFGRMESFQIKLISMIADTVYDQYSLALSKDRTILEARQDDEPVSVDREKAS
jgi:hypothetical protein